MSGAWVFWLVTGVVVVAMYAGACAWWPWTNCRRCRGRGKLFSPMRRHYRSCPSCSGSGRRVRIGRRLLGG